jgi:Xaa-Pro aminopeptidase
MMKENIRSNISKLRLLLHESGLDACLIYGSDPHLSEYVPSHYQTRRFISGFTGSAGFLAITAEKAALWTDSRYFLQAEEQLGETGIDLIRLKTAGNPCLSEWLKNELQAGSIVGTDESCISVNQFRALQHDLLQYGMVLKESGDLPGNIWTDRPVLPVASIVEHPLNFAGTDRLTKIETIKAELRQCGASMQLITALDDLAWTFNLRGSDIDFCPVFMAFATVETHHIVLFTDSKKLPAELKIKLENDDIQIKEYSEFTSYIRQLPSVTTVLIDPDRTNYAVFKAIPASAAVLEGLSVPCSLKACKSDAELSNIRRAMLQDGVALVGFLHWLQQSLGSMELNEFLIAEKLTDFRSRQDEYMGISFYPIVGYREHGAVVHLSVSAENALPVLPEGLLLFDSGGQYRNGTTDVTRTVALGPLSAKQKTDFTLVLKGMIALSKAKFPTGTRGHHLDILARKALWEHGLNYGHGTGHGVGYYLNVHEGPMSIRQEFNDYPVQAGMVVSNEPGLYRTGEYGIRTENLMVCVEDQSGEFGDFLGFETLTLCPIDTSAIDMMLLTDDEISWLNAYHQNVYQQLAPLLNDELTSFLAALTREI